MNDKLVANTVLKTRKSSSYRLITSGLHGDALEQFRVLRQLGLRL